MGLIRGTKDEFEVNRDYAILGIENLAKKGNSEAKRFIQISKLKRKWLPFMGPKKLK